MVEEERERLERREEGKLEEEGDRAFAEEC